MSWTDLGAEAELLRNANSTIMFPEALDRKKLDYTLGSLSVVDEYLRVIHRANAKRTIFGFIPARRLGEANPSVFNDPLFVPTMRMIGAYVGEILRREKAGMRWLSFAELKALIPSTAEFVSEADPLVREMNLAGPGDSVCWPANKAVKFVMNGDEDSLRFFALAMLRDKDQPNVETRS